ncbi:MAG: E3 binding domain-containing protein, partial [Rhizobiaceae bacterium]|nr:E3 binding domain-containing protein [Rhizobiaceae bacterium]
MPVEVILPKVDMDMATGQISRWFVAEGATVKQGELLFEIETDKAAMEIDSPAAGTLRDIVGKEGVDIPVGSAVAWIYAEGEAYAGAGSEAKPNQPAPAEIAVVEEHVSQPVGMEPEGPASSTKTQNGDVRATPLARRLARENGIALVDI